MVISDTMRHNETIRQFVAYIFVGGFAFLADIGSMVAFRELLFRDWGCGIYLSVLLAFFVGHIVNYLGSLWFVFSSPEERRAGWTWRAFALFAVVGASGAAMTEFGMWIGCGCLHANYIATKIVVASVVFVWNFIGRKLVVRKK